MKALFVEKSVNWEVVAVDLRGNVFGCIPGRVTAECSGPSVVVSY